MTSGTKLRMVCLCALSNGIPRRSFYVAMLVGTILNVINQGDALFGLGPFNWLKIILTYFVPYAVCTYGAVSAQLGPIEKRTGVGASWPQ